MPLTLTELENESLKLSTQERASLAEHLLESIDSEDDNDSEKYWIEEAEKRWNEGFRTFKIKVGVQSIEQDIERIGAVRKTLGEGANHLTAHAGERRSFESAIDGLAPLLAVHILDPRHVLQKRPDGHLRIQGRSLR